MSYNWQLLGASIVSVSLEIGERVMGGKEGGRGRGRRGEEGEVYRGKGRGRGEEGEEGGRGGGREREREREREKIQLSTLKHPLRPNLEEMVKELKGLGASEVVTEDFASSHGMKDLLAVGLHSCCCL